MGKVVSLTAPRYVHVHLLQLSVHSVLLHLRFPGALGVFQLPPGNPVSAERYLRVKANV